MRRHHRQLLERSFGVLFRERLVLQSSIDEILESGEVEITVTVQQKQDVLTLVLLLEVQCLIQHRLHGIRGLG